MKKNVKKMIKAVRKFVSKGLKSVGGKKSVGARVRRSLGVGGKSRRCTCKTKAKKVTRKKK